MVSNAEESLQDIIDNKIAGRVPAESKVEIGPPADSIVRVAQERGVELIVIATHGRSGIKGLLFGSVAERVVRTATCPVLTMRHEENE